MLLEKMQILSFLGPEVPHGLASGLYWPLTSLFPSGASLHMTKASYWCLHSAPPASGPLPVLVSLAHLQHVVHWDR